MRNIEFHNREKETMLIMITLAGLPCWVCRRKGMMMGWLHQIYGGKEYEKNRISQ